MSYRIAYGENPFSVARQGLRLGNVLRYTVVCLVLFYALTAAFWPEGKSSLQDLLLPGDSTVTARALENMIEDLREGEALGDAVVVFCREVLDSAQNSD